MKHITYLILGIGVLMLASCSTPSAPDPIDAACARMLEHEVAQ